MKKEFEEKYQKELERTAALPWQIREAYHLTACLKDTQQKQTYLLARKEDGRKYILKAAFGEEREYLIAEAKNMAMLGMAEETSLIEEGDQAYFLRAYVEGRSLAGLLEKKSVSEKEAVSLMLRLCQRVKLLHGRKPPVIHRDIKPENVICKPDGEIVLIDYETARNYREGKQEDTCFVGTKQTAAPEQYGFGQSDVRTDIYGIGRTMLYLLTGDYREEMLEKQKVERCLSHVVRKCCAFDPDRRYQSVDQLIGALNKCKTLQKEKRAGEKLLGGAVCLLFCMVILLLIQVGKLNGRLDELQNEKGTGRIEAEAEESGGTQTENVQGHIMIAGWDVTDYQEMLQGVLASCRQKDYGEMTLGCQELVSSLCKDEKLQQVATEDTFYYTPGDERWQEYNVTRLGYEKVADRLAYHDGMLQKEAENLEQYQYYIAVILRGNLEHTEIDENGMIYYTLLHQYEMGEKQEDLDFCIDELLGVIIEGIEFAKEEEK